ncbi:MAG: hypothetical protein DKINENOH_03914 [bacterium]|nr:hypothetical protein [bacterium]
MYSPHVNRRAVAWLALAFFAGLALPAQPQPENCWAPDKMQSVEASIARATPVAEWQKDLEFAGNLLKQVRTLRRIPEKRLRNNIYLGHPVPGFGHFARVSAMLYPPAGWAAGECGLGKGADYFNSGHVDITCNDPRLIFEHQPHAVRELQAYFEPPAAARLGDETLYHAGENWVVVLTPNRQPPWVPITVAEYLQFKTQEAEKRLAELETTLTEISKPFAPTPESLELIAEFRKTDPAQAEQLQQTIAETRRIWEENSIAGRKQYGELIQEQQKLIAEIAAYRSNLTTAERGAPARLGDGRFDLAAGGTLDRGKIVRLNPALSQGENPTRRIQLIVVNVFANDQTLWDELAQALREVDYPALRRLLR